MDDFILAENQRDQGITKDTKDTKEKEE